MYILNISVTFNAAVTFEIFTQEIDSKNQLNHALNLFFVLGFCFIWHCTRYRRENWKTGQQHRLNL